MWLPDSIEIISLVVVMEHASEPGAAEAMRIDIWKEDDQRALLHNATRIIAKVRHCECEPLMVV